MDFSCRAGRRAIRFSADRELFCAERDLYIGSNVKTAAGAPGMVPGCGVMG